MLPFVVVLVVIVYVVLDKSGLLSELAESIRGGRGGRRKWHPEIMEKTKSDPETDKRLEVFERFIENLDSSEDNED